MQNKPINGQMLFAIMVVGIVAAIVLSYVFYPDLGKENGIGDSDWPTTTEITVHIEGSLAVTYEGTTVTDGQVFTVPFKEDVDFVVATETTGTLHWSYTTTGYSGGSGSGSEYVRAGDSATVHAINFWDNTIDVKIWFEAEA